MTKKDVPVLVANCYQRYEGGIRPYDFNSWVDSDVAQKLGDSLGPKGVLFEGQLCAIYCVIKFFILNFLRLRRNAYLPSFIGIPV